MSEDKNAGRNEPQCLAGSFQQPGCAAERFKLRIADLERELADCRRELERSEKERIAATNGDDMKQLRDAWAETQVELVNMRVRAEVAESRLASHAESAGAEQEPCAWRYRYGKTGMWKYADRAEDTNQGEEYEREPLYPMPWQNQAPSPAPDSQADGLELEAWARQVCEGTNMSWPYLAEQVSLRSRQAPRGEGK